MKKIQLLILLVLVPWCIRAQSLNSIIKSGDLAFEKQNYYGAARLYEDAIKLDKRLYDVHYKAGEAYRLDNDYMKAIPHYKFVSENASKRFPLAEFYLAAMLKSSEDYFSAQFYFTRYYRQHSLDSTSYFTRKAKQEIVYCEKAIALKYNHTGLMIEPADTMVNSLYSEFGASTFVDSMLLFSSVKPSTADSTADFVSAIYITPYAGGRMGTPVLLPDAINSPGYHNAGPYFDPETQMLFFTRKSVEPGSKSLVMMSAYSDGKFGEARAMCTVVNDSNSNNTQAMLVHSDAKDILFFASDRSGGLGGYDIWYTFLDENLKADRARVAGVPPEVDNAYIAFFGLKSVINSPGNELCPFYNTKDSTLYFSSDWFIGLGAYDIYRSKTDFTIWQEPVNMGYPANSGQNDLYYFQDYKRGLAFLSSNRKEARALKHQSCCNDIFVHETEKIIPPEIIVEQQVNILRLEASELIPITLYFDNDHPNPNTWDTVTSINYSEAYDAYLNKQKQFESEFSKGYRSSEKTALTDSVARFFDNDVTGEYQKLLKFAALLKELVLKDQLIIITIKGYTSPLNTTEYNDALAKRRISSLENFFRTYDNGFFVPYEEEGKIIITRVAFGETMVRTGVSDDPNDRRNSVFSPLASAERKIRIIAVQVNKD